MASRWLLLNLNDHDHRKIIVADGTVAFAGQVNVGAVEERDTHLLRSRRATPSSP